MSDTSRTIKNVAAKGLMTLGRGTARHWILIGFETAQPGPLHGMAPCGVCVVLPCTGAIACIDIQFRKDDLSASEEVPKETRRGLQCANHAPHRCGKECRGGPVGWSLPAPPARANLSLPDCRTALPGIRRPSGGAGQGIAGVCPTGIRGLSPMRPAGAWFPAGALRVLPR